jgi:LPS export ABC transporter protein LptC
MSNWQRRTRLLIALFAVAFTVVVAFAFRRRPPAPPAATVSRTDPNAVIESTGGRIVRVKGGREDVSIEYERQLTYAGGSTRLLGVKVVTEERGDGRTFTVTGKEGRVSENQSTITLTGDVRLAASDGLTVATEHATYADSEGIVRAPSSGHFARGRLTGSGIGLTYDTNGDVLTILQQAVIRMTPDASGGDDVKVTSGTATFARRDKYVRFERDVKVLRIGEVIEADTATAYLSPDDQHIESLQLSGNSRISRPSANQGGLGALMGRDITLKYASGGQALEQVLIVDDAVVRLAGEADKAGCEIAANAIDIALAPDGSTPTALVGRDDVRLTFPADAASPSRTIRAAALDAKGQQGRGLTSAQLVGSVDFREKRGTADRVVRSGMLTLVLKGGMGAIEDAEFARAVRFEEGQTKATSAAARYVLDKGILELTGSEPGTLRPHVATEQISVEATRIDVTLAGPKMNATGDVKSVLQTKKQGAVAAKGGEMKRPSLLKQDQPVNVTGGELNYDGPASKATYTGNAQLWQGDTAIAGEFLCIDEKSGDVTATGSVRTAVMLAQVSKDGKTKHRARSVGTAKEFKYEEGARCATFLDGAHLSGSAGDLTASRIELYLTPSGDELERAEAYDSVTVRENARKTTGTRMTYFVADERYVVTGAPGTILDECGRETIGKTLTFFKATDRIVVDGNEQIRTQTKGGGVCK